MDFMSIAERLGIPTMVLVVFSVAVWRVLKWVGNKVVTPITESHIALVHEARETNKTNCETLKKMTEILEVKAVVIGQIANQHQEVLRLTQETHKEVMRSRQKDPGA